MQAKSCTALVIRLRQWEINRTVWILRHQVLRNGHVVSRHSVITAVAGQDYLPGGGLDVDCFAAVCKCAFQSQEEVELSTTLSLLLK